MPRRPRFRPPTCPRPSAALCSTFPRERITFGGSTRAARAHPQLEGAGRTRPGAPAVLRRPGHLRPGDQAHLRALLDLRRPRVAGEEAGRFLDLPDRAAADGHGAGPSGGREGVPRFQAGRHSRALQPLPAPRHAGLRRTPRQRRRRAHLLVSRLALPLRRHERVGAAAARVRGHDLRELRPQHEAGAAGRVLPRLRVREPRRGRAFAARSGSGRRRSRSTTSATARPKARSRW